MEGVGGDVSVETTHGDVKVRGGSGFVSLKSVQGEITLEKAKGRVEVRAVNESIHLADISGDLSAESTNGSIILDRIDSGNVDLYTVNGNISYDGAIKDKGLYRLTTHNGLIAMPIADKANVTLTVRTYNGSFRSTLPACWATTRSKRNKRFTVTLGNGSAHVELESFGGTIALRRPSDPRPETERKRRSERDKDKEKDKEKAKDKGSSVPGLDRLDRRRSRRRRPGDGRGAARDRPRRRRGDARGRPEIERAMARGAAGDRRGRRRGDGELGRDAARDADAEPDRGHAAPSRALTPSAARRLSRDRRSAVAASSSATVFPLTGSRRSGATAASGSSTNRRSRNRGCGTTSPGSSSTTSPNRIRSRSSVRGAFAYGPLAAALLLDGEQRVEQRPRRSASCRRRRRRSGTSPAVRRRRPARCRSSGRRGGWRGGREARDGVVEMGAPIADVAAERDRYSIHREGSTSP